MLYLGVVTDSEAGDFGLWEVELALLRDIHDLDGHRIHVRPSGECYEDDTLGTDMIGAYNTSDLNYWAAKDRSYVYGDVLVEFSRIQGRIYRVHFQCTLSDSDEDPQALSPEDYWARGTADFTVEVDEDNPYDD